MDIREISTEKINETVKNLCIEANYELGYDVVEALENSIGKEESGLGRMVLNELVENAGISKTDRVPLCQDCGTCVVFVEIGQNVHVTGGDLRQAVNAGVKSGYEIGYLRKSICDPFTRKNTGDNAPAVIHFDIIPGDRLKITVAPKGGGSENMSRIKMLPPSSGVEGIKDFIIDSVKDAGGNPCPPVILGIGIGGNFERCAYLAKKALMRNIGDRNSDPRLADLENEFVKNINSLGIGPMGYGGRNTCLDVFIEFEHCHIASLPVALNINCHSARHKQAVI